MFKTLVNLFSKAAKKYAGYSQPSLFDELDFSSPAKDDYSSRPKHVKGNPRENHKYIERKPNPNKPGEFIYIYEMPDGSRYESEQETGKPTAGNKLTDQFFSLFSRHKTPSLFEPEEPETEPKPKPVNPEPVKDLNEIVEATPKKESSGDVIQDYLNSKQAGKTYRDLNERVRGSRKEAAAIRKLMALDILNLDTATQYERINKKLVLPEFDPYARKEAGESAGATYIKMKLYEAITSRPANSQVAREIYVKFVPAFMEEVYACTDYEEIHKLFDKYFVKAYDRSTNRVVRKFNDNAVQKVKEVGVNGTDDQLSIIFGEDIFGKNFLNLLGMSTDSAHKHRMLARQYEGHDAEKELAKKIEILNKKKDEINNLTEDTVYQKILAKYDRRSPDLAYELSRNNMFEKYGNFSLSFYNFYPALNRMPETERNQMFRELAGIQLERDRKAVSQLANEDDLRELYSGTSKAPDWSWLPDKDKEAEQSFQLESEDEPEKKEVVKEFPKLLRVIRTNGREVTDDEVTVENLQNLFGYNSVQFGNWVKDHEAREHVKHFIASMKDMEDILGIDIKKINETGGLNIAFGARGKSKALAHYEPMRKIINLTKTKGDGTIAHEWAHFFDHLIGGGDPNKEDTKGFATNAKAVHPEIHKVVAELMDEIHGGKETKSVEFKVPDKKPTITFHGLDPIRIMKSPSLTPEQKIEELVNTAQNILDKSIYVKGRTAELLGELIAYYAQKPISLNLHEPNSFYENSKAQQNKKYYTAPHELFARAFESYIEDKCAQNGIYNNYLVSDNSADKENVLKRNTKVYPQGNHRQKLNKIFDKLIEKTKQVYGVAKEPDTDSKRVNEVIDYTGSADGSLFKSIITTEETTMFRKLQNLCKSQQPNHKEINRKLSQNLTEMLQKARKIKYTADDYSIDFPHDFSDIKDNLFDGMEKNGLRLEPAHSNPNVRRYHRIDQAEVQKEASEHPGTFDKIQNNEITTPEELGAAIADDHKEKEQRESLTSIESPLYSIPEYKKAIDEVVEGMTKENTQKDIDELLEWTEVNSDMKRSLSFLKSNLTNMGVFLTSRPKNYRELESQNMKVESFKIDLGKDLPNYASMIGMKQLIKSDDRFTESFILNFINEYTTTYEKLYEAVQKYQTVNPAKPESDSIQFRKYKPNEVEWDLSNKPFFENAKMKTLEGNLVIDADYNTYKGGSGGKLWIAKIPKQGSREYEFLKPSFTRARDSYSGEKTFDITEDGIYAYNNFQTKSSSERIYFTVKDGEIYNDQRWDLFEKSATSETPQKEYEIFTDLTGGEFSSRNGSLIVKARPVNSLLAKLWIAKIPEKDSKSYYFLDYFRTENENKYFKIEEDGVYVYNNGIYSTNKNKQSTREYFTVVGNQVRAGQQWELLTSPVGKSLYQTMRKALKKKFSIIELTEDGKKLFQTERYPTYGEIEFQGLTIVVENKPGTLRSGTDPDGEKWKTKMFYPYGYIKGTKATDGEGVDVYVGKDKTSEKVFIIHQRDPENNKYDEDKVMLGFNTKEAARDAYLAHYDSYKFLGEITEMSIEQFREKLKTRKGKMIKSELSLFGKMLKALKKFTVPDWQMEFDFGGSPEEPQEGATNQKGETLLPSKVNPKVNRWQKTAATTEPIATVEAGRFFTESELRDAAKPKQPHEMTFKEYIGTQWSKEREERVLSDLQRSKTELSQIKNGTLSPSKVIGTGVSYPKKTAIEYLEQSIIESEEELKNKYADYDIRNYLYHVIRAQDAGETISPEVQQDTKLLGEKLAGIKHDEPTPKVETTVPEIKTPEPVKQPKPEVKPKKNKGGWTSKLLGLGGSHDRLEKLEPGEMSAVERHFREFNQIEFTSGSTKVKTTDDVAYMFKQLEDEAIEHAFICFINKTGEPIIQHIGTGSFDYSIVSAASIIPILANNDDIKEVYFVHNHPSGNLDISDADQLTFLRLQNIVNTYASTELKMTGLVIDGKDCKYATFDYDTSDKHSPKFTNDPSKDVKVPVVSFSKLKLKEDVYTDKITSPHQMAEVITKLRFTEGSKANIFILNAGGRVVGRFNFNTYTSATNSRKAQAREIADLIVTTGGKSAVLAIKPADGDHEINMEDTSMYNGLRTDLELVDCKLFDLIKIGNRPGLYSNVATR